MDSRDARSRIDWQSLADAEARASDEQYFSDRRSHVRLDDLGVVVLCCNSLSPDPAVWERELEMLRAWLQSKGYAEHAIGYYPPLDPGAECYPGYTYAMVVEVPPEDVHLLLEKRRECWVAAQAAVAPGGIGRSPASRSKR